MGRFQRIIKHQHTVSLLITAYIFLHKGKFFLIILLLPAFTAFVSYVLILAMDQKAHHVLRTFHNTKTDMQVLNPLQ